MFNRNQTSPLAHCLTTGRSGYYGNQAPVIRPTLAHARCNKDWQSDADKFVHVELPYAAVQLYAHAQCKLWGAADRAAIAAHNTPPESLLHGHRLCLHGNGATVGGVPGPSVAALPGRPHPAHLQQNPAPSPNRGPEERSF